MLWDLVVVEGGGAGVTTNSRHCGVGCLRVGLAEVVMVEGEGMTDWKAWIGRASKNSWANMKGVLDGSCVGEFG